MYDYYGEGENLQRYDRSTSEYMDLEQVIELGTMKFSELTAIMARFEELGIELKGTTRE